MPSRLPRLALSQRGQTMIFVVLFLAAVCLSLVFLYKAGKVTSEKMQVQNAADAAAYSVSVVEARDLNFMAYTNRAMVANEVAIGQLVGMASWATHWTSFESYLMAYERLFIYPLVMGASLGTSGDAVENVFKTATNLIFKVPGDLFYKVFKVAANIGASVLHNINKVYSYGQTGYHFASVLYSLSAYIDLVEDNAPDAKISDFGILSMIAHTLTYVELLPGYDSFIKTYRPTKAEHAAGFERFAAVVNGSKDEFSRKRGWTLPLDIPPLPIDIDFSGPDRFSLEIGPFEVWLELVFKLSFDLEKTGASELRYVGDTATGTEFNWSAADATSLLAEVFFRIAAGLDAFGGTVASGDFSLGFADGEASGALILSALGIDVEIFDLTLPFPTSAPFSSGAAQAGKTKLNHADLYGVDKESYGGTPKHSQAWGMDPTGTAAPPFVGWRGPVWSHYAYQVPTVIATMPTTERRVNTSYKGLPMYSDSVIKENPWGFEAPYFLAGVVKDDVDIYSDNAPLKTVGSCQDTVDTKMRIEDIFHLNDSCIADGEIAAIAKSEVYFSRPADLAYFTRADGKEEYGNAFNPYWQARLVETTNADRTFSVGLQQKQAFGVIAGIADLISTLESVPTDIMSWFP